MIAQTTTNPRTNISNKYFLIFLTIIFTTRWRFIREAKRLQEKTDWICSLTLLCFIVLWSNVKN